MVNKPLAGSSKSPNNERSPQVLCGSIPWILQVLGVDTVAVGGVTDAITL